MRCSFLFLLKKLGIEPKMRLNPFLKTALDVFCMHKTVFFSLILFSLYNLIYGRL